jgi:hypothetical protein
MGWWRTDLLRLPLHLQQAGREYARPPARDAISE